MTTKLGQEEANKSDPICSTKSEARNNSNNEARGDSKMEARGDLSRKQKVFQLEHLPNVFADMIFLPFGEYYNREYRSIKAGDIIEFYGGKRAIVLYCGIRPLRDSYMQFLCRLTYHTEVIHIVRKWRANAVINGCAPTALNKNHAIFIHFKWVPEED